MTGVALRENGMPAKRNKGAKGILYGGCYSYSILGLPKPA